MDSEPAQGYSIRSESGDDEEYFIVDFNQEPEDDLRKQYFLLNENDPGDTIEPANFAVTIAALNKLKPKIAGKKSKAEEFVFENGLGGIVKCKDRYWNAGIRTLQEEYGNSIPQPFVRPRYKSRLLAGIPRAYSQDPTEVQ